MSDHIAPEAGQRAPEPLRVVYRNWRGETAVRRILPNTVTWCSTEHHPEPQWIMRAFDVDREVWRDFAMRDMSPAVEAALAPPAPDPAPPAVSPVPLADEADDVQHWHDLAVAETRRDGSEVLWKERALAAEALLADPAPPAVSDVDALCAELDNLHSEMSHIGDTDWARIVTKAQAAIRSLAAERDMLRLDVGVVAELYDETRNRLKTAEAARDALVGALRAVQTLFSVLDRCHHVERGVGGMTIDAQLRRTVINGVPAYAVEEAREAADAALAAMEGR